MRRDPPNREANLESGLTIRLFGGMAIHDSGGVDYLPRSRKTRAIVAMLTMTAPKSVQRVHLTALLWSQRGTQQGRASLRQAVHELQWTLGSAWNRILVAERHCLTIDLNGVTVDAFEAVGSGASKTGLLALFEDGFLEDLDGLDPAFDIWLAKERRRMVSIARTGGEAFLEEQHPREATIPAARSLLRLDPANDRGWRALIEAHIAANDRAAARFACVQWGVAIGIPLDEAPPAEIASFLSRIRFGSDYRPPDSGQLGAVANRVMENVIPPDRIPFGHQDETGEGYGPLSSSASGSPSLYGSLPVAGNPSSPSGMVRGPLAARIAPVRAGFPSPGGATDARVRPGHGHGESAPPGAHGVPLSGIGRDGTGRDETGRDGTPAGGVLADGVTPGRVLPNAAVPDRAMPVRVLSDEVIPDRAADGAMSGRVSEDVIVPDRATPNRTRPDRREPYRIMPGGDTRDQADAHTIAPVGVMEDVFVPNWAAIPGRLMPDGAMPDGAMPDGAMAEPVAPAGVMEGVIVPTGALPDGSSWHTPETKVWNPATAPWTGGEPGRTSLRLGIREMRVIGANVDQALSAGLAEEVTTALSRFRWISCVSGSSLAAIAGDTGEINLRWPELDLDLLLDGTIQRGGEQIRVTVRLLDMRAGAAVIWANRFDHDASDTLTLQDRVAAAIVAQVDPMLLIREGDRAAARNPRGALPRDLVLQAVPAIYRMDRLAFHAAGELLEAALRADPTHTDALAWYAYWHLFLVGQGWADDPDAATRRAGVLADTAVAMDPNDARALTLAGHVRGFLLRRPAEAAVLHERAISLNPNLAIAWCFSGFTFSYLGDHATALARMNKAIELSPSDPHLFFFQAAVIMPHLLLGEYEEAVAAGRKAIELNPWFSSSFKGLLAALGHLGQAQEATSVMARLAKLEPNLTVRDAIARSPMGLTADIQRYADGLRRAGLPEW
jgi:DNA-binding SARP family transcriptional activator/TolB-like protein/Flp pilus assembly protein TadD